MRRTIRNLVLVTMVAFMMNAEKVGAQAQADSPQIVESPLLTTNRILQASLDRIFRGSALWREAVEAVVKTGRHIVLVTPADPIVRIAKADREVFDSGVLAEAVPLMDE